MTKDAVDAKRSYGMKGEQTSTRKRNLPRDNKYTKSHLALSPRADSILESLRSHKGNTGTATS